MLAAGWPPGTTDAAVQVVVRATFAVVRVADHAAGGRRRGGRPVRGRRGASLTSFMEIWARLAVASAGVICGRVMNEFIAFEIPSTALAIADGRARQAGMYPMLTVGQPGPGTQRRAMARRVAQARGLWHGSAPPFPSPCHRQDDFCPVFASSAAAGAVGAAFSASGTAPAEFRRTRPFAPLRC